MINERQFVFTGTLVEGKEIPKDFLPPVEDVITPRYNPTNLISGHRRDNRHGRQVIDIFVSGFASTIYGAILLGSPGHGTKYKHGDKFEVYPLNPPIDLNNISNRDVDGSQFICIPLMQSDVSSDPKSSPYPRTPSGEEAPEGVETPSDLAEHRDSLSDDQHTIRPRDADGSLTGATFDENGILIRGSDGSAVNVSGRDIALEGNVRQTGTDIERPQQMTGIDTQAPPMADTWPRSNVLMPMLDRIPNTQKILNLAMLCHDIYKTIKNLHEFFSNENSETEE